MKCIYTPLMRKLTLSILASATLLSCVNEEYDFDKINTDEITLFSDSIILPLGSTQEILMSDIITDEVLSDIGLSSDGSGYKFDYNGSYPEDGTSMDFGITPITFDAPTLPTIAGSTIEIGSFSLTNNPISIKVDINVPTYDGKVEVTHNGGDVTDPNNYAITISPIAQQSARHRMMLPSIGRPINTRNMLSHANDIAIEQNTDAIVPIPIPLPEGVTVQKFFDFSIGEGMIHIKLVKNQSSQSIQDLDFDFSNLTLIFPEEFEIEEGDGVFIENNRYKKAFNTNGSLSVTIKKINFEKRSTGNKFISPTGSPTTVDFNFSYAGTIYIAKPSSYTEIYDLNNTTVALGLDVFINGPLAAVSLEAKGVTKNIDIDPVSINIGKVAIPKEVIALQSVSINEVTMNLTIPKINIGALNNLAINGALEIGLPDFCTIEGATKTNGKWNISFSNLQQKDINIAVKINHINTPTLINNEINFPTEIITVNGTVIVPEFRQNNITEINLSGNNTPTISPKLNYANNTTLVTVKSVKAAITTKGKNIKVPLEMLANLRGEKEGDLSINNLTFTNPSMIMNLIYTLPSDFNATLQLKPYLNDQLINEGILTFTDLVLKKDEGQKTLTPSAQQINSLISQLPDSLVLSYDIKAGTESQPVTFAMDDLINAQFRTTYAMSLPLAFGSGLEISKIIDTDVSSIFADDTVIKLLFGKKKSKLTLLGQADNGIPLDVALTFIPKDADGNTIASTDVSIPGVTLKAGSIIDNTPIVKRTTFDLTVIGSPTNVKRISTLGIEVKAIAASSASIRQDCSLKIAFKAKILGGIQINVN